METIHLLNQIARKLRDGKLAIFIGAGLPKCVDSHYPTGDELKMALISELPNQKELLKLNLLDVAEEYESRYSRIELEQFVYGRIFGDSSTYSSLCQALALFPADIVTTNYDSLLEDNFTEVNALDSYNLIIEDSDICKNKPGRALLKMHGSCSPNDRPRRIVLTTSDYKNFIKSNPLTVAQLKIILSKSVLFLGYSLKDSDFREIFKSVREDLGVSASQCYVQIRPAVTDNSGLIEGEGIHYLERNLDDLIKHLFRLVYFSTSGSNTLNEDTYGQKGIGSMASDKEEVLLRFLYSDQFDSGLWGKSIQKLFLRCFSSPNVPDEYQNFGSFTATDIVLRDILPLVGFDERLRISSIIYSINKKTNHLGGVGIKETIETSKFSLRDTQTDPNIRHTCAVLNINLLLGNYEYALLNLTWLSMFEDVWIDERDGKLQINIACLIDCFDHIVSNRGFADFCYLHPKEFIGIKDIILNWEIKRRKLFSSLNRALVSSKGLWILKNGAGDFINDTQIYITLFILLRLTQYPRLFPKEFSRIVDAIYNMRSGYGIPISPSSADRPDAGATGTFLKILFDENAQNALKNEMPEKSSEILTWANTSYKTLLEDGLTSENLTLSFAEIISPVLSLIRQTKEKNRGRRR